MESNWEFRHVGVVVRDMDKAVKYYQSLGITTFRPEFMLDSSTFTDYEVYGKTPDTTDKSRFRFIRFGPASIELIQPVEGKPIYKEFLNSKGEGIHHLAFTVDSLDAEMAKLVEQGVKVILSAKLSNGAAFAYFDTRKVGNFIIELVQQPK